MRHAIKQHNFHHYHYSSSVWSAQYIISYILFVPVLLIKASFFALYDMACDFKGRINCHSHFPCNLNRVVGFWKTNYTNVEAKVEPHTIYTLNVFLTHSPFLFYDCGVHTFSYDCGLNSSKIKGKLNACRNNAPFRYP